MLNFVDRFLNKITMYKLVSWGLSILAAISIVFAFLGKIAYGGEAHIFSLALLIGVCWISNAFFAWLFKAPANIESWTITALILYFIVLPVTTTDHAIVALLVGFLAIASKFIITINKRHIFNPVAIGAVAVGLLGMGNVLWWVGTPFMLPFVAVLGFLIVRKIRKFTLLFSFLGAAIATILIIEPTTLVQNIISWPLVFFGTIMLTEPFTLPPRRKEQIAYGIIIGVLFIVPYHFANIYSTPELALVIGNLFSYALSFKKRLMLTLKEKKEVSKETFEFSFASDSSFNFLPGQYFEWTIPSQNMDTRGNRRYFTIASSPTEKDIKLGIKFYTPSSTFKNDLQALPVGGMISAGQLMGDFVMPKDPSKKLVFIAGGIGVTPFRSMIKYLVDTNQKRDIVLIYGVKEEAEIAYKEILEEAERVIGLKVFYLVKDFLTKEIIAREVPDFNDRIFYLSGPNVMVENAKKILISSGIKRSSIHTDYFPGF